MPHTLLLVDDDVTLRAVLRLALTQWGFRVEVARDASSGLQKASDLKPDLILLDIMLLDVDGWESCLPFREVCDAPIIVLMSLSSENDFIKGLKRGADIYLAKPVTVEELVGHIYALLRHASRAKFKSQQTRAPVNR